MEKDTIVEKTFEGTIKNLSQINPEASYSNEKKLADQLGPQAEEKLTNYLNNALEQDLVAELKLVASDLKMNKEAFNTITSLPAEEMYNSIKKLDKYLPGKLYPIFEKHSKFQENAYKLVDMLAPNMSDVKLHTKVIQETADTHRMLENADKEITTRTEHLKNHYDHIMNQHLLSEEDKIGYNSTLDFSKSRRELVDDLVDEFSIAFMKGNSYITIPENLNISINDAKNLYGLTVEISKGMNQIRSADATKEQKLESMEKTLLGMGNYVTKVLESKGVKFRANTNLFNTSKNIKDKSLSYQAVSTNQDADLKMHLGKEFAYNMLTSINPNLSEEENEKAVVGGLLSFANGPGVSRDTIIASYDGNNLGQILGLPENQSDFVSLLPLTDKKKMSEIYDSWASHTYPEGEGHEVKTASSTSGLMNVLNQCINHRDKIDTYSAMKEDEKEISDMITSEVKVAANIYSDSYKTMSEVVNFVVDNTKKYGLDDTIETVKEISKALKPNGVMTKNFYERLAVLDNELPRAYAQEVMERQGMREAEKPRVVEDLVDQGKSVVNTYKN